MPKLNWSKLSSIAPSLWTETGESPSSSSLRLLFRSLVREHRNDVICNCVFNNISVNSVSLSSLRFSASILAASLAFIISSSATSRLIILSAKSRKLAAKLHRDMPELSELHPSSSEVTSTSTDLFTWRWRSTLPLLELRFEFDLSAIYSKFGMIDQLGLKWRKKWNDWSDSTNYKIRSHNLLFSLSSFN